MFTTMYLVAGVITAFLMSMYDKKQAILSEDPMARVIQLLVIVMSGFYGLVLWFIFYLIDKGKI